MSQRTWPTRCLFGASCLILLAWVTDGPAPAKPQAVAAKPAKKPLAPDDIDVDRSRSFTFVGKSRLGHEHAIEGKVKSGRLHLGATRVAGELVFDMASFQADTLEARRYLGLEGETSSSTQQKVTSNMLGSDVLDVARFPTATFAIESAVPVESTRRTKGPQYALDGKFTLHGVTKPLHVVADADATGSFTRLRGKFQIRQTEFGITPYSTGLGAIGVADQLAISADIWVAADAERR